MSFCYGIAWIFLFEMSHHTSLFVKYPGRSLNFPPAQSCFESSFGKASSDAGERAVFLDPPFMKSWVSLTVLPFRNHENPINVIKFNPRKPQIHLCNTTKKKKKSTDSASFSHICVEWLNHIK